MTETILATQVHLGMTLWFLHAPFVVDMIGTADPDAQPVRSDVLIRARSAALRASVTMRIPATQWVVVDTGQPSVAVPA